MRPREVAKLMDKYRDFLENYVGNYFIVLTRSLKSKDRYCISIIPIHPQFTPIIHICSKHYLKMYNVIKDVLREILGVRSKLDSDPNENIIVVFPEIGEIILTWCIAYSTVKTFPKKILKVLLTYGVPDILIELKNRVLKESFFHTSKCCILDSKIVRKYSRIFRKIINKYVKVFLNSK